LNLVSVEGWGASGKSLILSYLDYHDDVFAIPVHDKTHYSFLRLDPSQLQIEHQDVRDIRKVLDSHGYYNIEYSSILGRIPVLLSSKKDDVFDVPFEHNFEAFEQDWKAELIEKEPTTIWGMLEIVYRAFIKHTKINVNVGSSTYNWLATMGDARSVDPKEFLIKYPQSRIIYVQRNMSDIIAIRSNRVTPKGLASGMFEKDFFKILLSGEVQKILNYEYRLKSVPDRLQERILWLNFDDVIYDKKSAFKEINEFLGCDNIELKPSLLGNIIEKSGVDYGASKNDTGEQILSRLELYLVRYLERLGRISKHFNSCISLILKVPFLVLRIANNIKRKMD
jgi:hypothetical protein